MVCVVFRASPLIWPTLFGATHAPRPLYKVTPAGFFLAGLWVLVSDNKRVSSPKASAYRGPCAAKSLGVPALRFAAAGMTC